MVDWPPVSIFITRIEPAADGPRLAVKDLFDTAGVRTTYGSAIFADHVPQATAPAVSRLVEAGHVMIGKANLHEFAWGITSDNAHFGRVPNPLAADRTSGGSSGGCAAALAAGLADTALGTDSGGSIRIPSACCGTTGFKPTHGLVPMEGCWPLAPSFDTAGPMARDVAGCAAAMPALVPGFPALPDVSLRDLRVGVAWAALADPLVRARVEAAAARLPHAVLIDVPFPTGTVDAFRHEAADAHRELFATERARYSENVAVKVDAALRLAAIDAARARVERDRYRERMQAIFRRVDLLLTPTIPTVAPLAAPGEAPIRDRMLGFTYPFNAVGAPALALPCGPAEDGLPASVQLAGPPGADALVLAAGLALEEAVRPVR